MPLHPTLEHAGFVIDPAGREVLGKIYREYIDIGQKFGIPMLVGTPTWRANPERSAEAGLSCESLNRESVRFLRSIRDEFGGYGSDVMIAGLIGCRGDAYNPANALSRDEAKTFHTRQLESLAQSGVDLLMAATLPSAAEAEGIALAMESTGLPYVLSFITTGDGTVLDGTPLDQAIRPIDRLVSRRPIGFMVNCVHPSTFRKTYQKVLLSAPDVAERILGLQANTSPRSPSELDGVPALETEDPAVLADSMIRLHEDFGLRVLGGCCGTDSGHISEIGSRISRLMHSNRSGSTAS